MYKPTGGATHSSLSLVDATKCLLKIKRAIDTLLQLSGDCTKQSAGVEKTRQDFRKTKIKFDICG